MINPIIKKRLTVLTLFVVVERMLDTDVDGGDPCLTRLAFFSASVGSCVEMSH